MSNQLNAYAFYGIPLTDTEVEKYLDIEECIDEIGYSGYGDLGDGRGGYLYAEQSRVTTYWCEFGELDKIPFFGDTKDWDTNLKRLCKIIGIEYRQPGWYFCASYG